MVCDYIAKQGSLYIEIAVEDVAIFRFLLEAYENLALFTALQKNPCILKIIFAVESRDDVAQMLNRIARTVPFKYINLG